MLLDTKNFEIGKKLANIAQNVCKVCVEWVEQKIILTNYINTVVLFSKKKVYKDYFSIFAPYVAVSLFSYSNYTPHDYHPSAVSCLMRRVLLQ